MTIFEQLEKLRESVPRLSLMNFHGENSEYGNFTFQCKNSYLNVGSDFLENSYYNYWGYHDKNCTDCSYCRYCEGCYECLDCTDCVNCSFIQDCVDCDDCFACFDCVSCTNCFACIGLNQKEYHVYNKPYSKEEYTERLNRLRRKSPDELRKLFKEVKLLRPHIYMHEARNMGACTGDYVYYSANSRFCFDVQYSNSCLYMNNAINCVNCIDISFAGETSLRNCYEIMSGMGLENCKFCRKCWHGKELEYCDLCFECEYCFLCVGLKGRKYSILNETYNPEAYFRKVAELKQQMKRENSYGKWLSSTYLEEDSIVCDKYAAIEYSLQKRPSLKPRLRSLPSSLLRPS